MLSLCKHGASNGVRMHRAYLIRNTDRVHVTGTLSPGSVAPVSFIKSVYMESFSCVLMNEPPSLGKKLRRLALNNLRM